MFRPEDYRWMKRRVLNVLRVVTLLLCAAFAALWVDTGLLGHTRRPYNRPIYVAGGGIRGRVEVLCWRDGITVHVGEYGAYSALGTRYQEWRIPCARLQRHSGRSNGFDCEISHWLLLGVTGLPAGCFALHVLVRRRRHPETACPGCGYDLRATPSRCPECGAAAPVAIAQ